MTLTKFVPLVILSPAIWMALAQAPNPNSQYRLGPDSMAQDGVPKGEIRGPFTLPSKVYPGTQHTYWVYVPAQYDPAVPTALMVLSGRPGVQGRKRRSSRPERHGQPDLPPRDSGDDRRLHQSRPHARAARTHAAELGRPDHQPPHRIQHARRQVCARDHRRADAGALQGVQHFEGPGAARNRRIQFRRDRGFRGGLGASQRFPQSAEQCGQLREYSRRLCVSRARAGEREESRSACSSAMDATTTAGSAATASTTRNATGFSRMCG